MSSSFIAKFGQDLEIIYAKYSSSFDGAPELPLSTCELPNNIKLIESYESRLEDRVEEFTSDEESQSSCYDSDNSFSSDGGGNVQLEKSFREKYPRWCAKTNIKTSTSTLTSLKSQKNMVKTTRSSDQTHNLVYKERHGKHEDERIDGDVVFNNEVENCKSGNGTVTLSKDLWSQVQQCLRLMTSVFTQLDSNYEEENTHGLENHPPNKPSQQEFSQKSLIKSSFVKQKLYQDDKKSKSRTPQVIEKLFVRRKGVSGPCVELASRKSFLQPRSTSRICEIESLDSGFCQENSSESDSRQHPQFKCSNNPDNIAQELPGKNRRRRYRLVRRRSSKTRQESTSETPTKESDGYQETRPRKEHSFKPYSSISENIPEKTKKMTFDIVHCDSPDMDEVELIEAPPTPGVPPSSSQIGGCPRNRLVTVPSEEQVRSSTPRKQMSSGINNTAAYSLDPDAYLRRSSSKKRTDNTRTDSMPSPIRPAFNSKTRPTETTIICNSFTSNVNNSSLFSSKSQNTLRDSLPNTISSKSTRRAIFQPEISVNFLKIEDISKTRPGSVSNEEIPEHSTRSSCTQNTEKLFPCTPADTRRRSSSKLKRDDHNCASSDNHHQSPQQKMTPRRTKFHPYAAYRKFPRSSLLTSPFRDLSIKSPSSYDRWTTLDRSPMPICVTKARRMQSGSASQKNLEFGLHDACSEYKKTTPREEMKNENSLQHARKNFLMEQPITKQNDDSACSDCSSGQCTKLFCFNCSMNLS